MHAMALQSNKLHPHIGPRCAWLGRRAGLKNAIAGHRISDVLQAPLAEAVEPKG
jgi:hypothetical protein